MVDSGGAECGVRGTSLWGGGSHFNILKIKRVLLSGLATPITCEEMAIEREPGEREGGGLGGRMS